MLPSDINLMNELLTRCSPAEWLGGTPDSTPQETTYKGPLSFILTHLLPQNPASNNTTLPIIPLYTCLLSSWTQKPPTKPNQGTFRGDAHVYLVADEKWLVPNHHSFLFVLNVSERDATGSGQFVDSVIMPIGRMTVSTQMDRDVRGRRFWKRTSVVLKHASTNLKTLLRQRLLSYFINHISNLDSVTHLPRGATGDVGLLRARV